MRFKNCNISKATVMISLTFVSGSMCQTTPPKRILSIQLSRIEHKHGEIVKCPAVSLLVSANDTGNHSPFTRLPPPN